MRRSTNLSIPMGIITVYYLLVIGFFIWLINTYPQTRGYLPIGGIDDMMAVVDDNFEIVETFRRSASDFSIDPNGAIKLFFATIGTAILMIPVSWVYILTNRASKIEQSFVQTIVVLPIVVTGIAMVVQNSLALAFSLAGIVAAVRFRFTLEEPSHALYIFTAISIGLAAGIGDLGVAGVISMTFVYAVLVLWKLDYGRSFSGPFFSLLSRRNREDAD